MVNEVTIIGSSHVSRYLENYWPRAGGFSVVDALGNAITGPDRLGNNPMAHDGSYGNRMRKG